MSVGKTLLMYEVDKSRVKHKNIPTNKKKITKPTSNLAQLHHESQLINSEIESIVSSIGDKEDDLDGKRTPNTVSSYEMVSSSATPSRSGRSSPKEGNGVQCTDLKTITCLMEEASQDVKNEEILLENEEYRMRQATLSKKDEKDFEISKLKSELENQTKLNFELKNLLVASLGGSLVPKLEKLIEDKCRAENDSQFVTNSLSRHSDLIDNFGALCRSYQTKYLAARLMSKHLDSLKEEIGEVYNRVGFALEKTLAERKVISTSLLQTLDNLAPLLPSHEVQCLGLEIKDLPDLACRVAQTSRLVISHLSDNNKIHHSLDQCLAKHLNQPFTTNLIDNEIMSILKKLKERIDSDGKEDASLFKGGEKNKEKILNLEPAANKRNSGVGQVKVV